MILATRDLTPRELARQRAYFERVRRAETTYALQLRKIARYIGDLVRGFGPEVEPAQVPELVSALRQYGETLRPWARRVATRMIAEVDRRDERAWRQLSNEVGEALRAELRSPVGFAAETILRDQVELITSLPIGAAQRVQTLAYEAATAGRRHTDVVQEIMRSGEVTRSRANLIARTEVGKAQAAITQARARNVGSTHYVWCTARDRDVRKTHKRLEGTVHAWDDPPVAEVNGERHHPGEFPNCFPGSTVVDLRYGCRALWRAPYDGPLILLEIGADVIECTPNHPILTTRGWVGAQSVEEGDEILCVSMQGTRVGRADEDERVATFKDLFRAGSLQFGARDVGPGLDFHGDLINGYVNQVTVDDYLPGWIETMPREDVAQDDLGRGYGWGGDTCGGRVDHVTGAGFPRVLDSGDVLFSSLPKGNDPVSIGPVSLRDVIARKNASDRGRRAAIALGQGRRTESLSVQGDDFLLGKSSSQTGCSLSLADRRINPQGAQLLAEDVRVAPNRLRGLLDSQPGAYELRRVVDKGTRDFSGHVYTMQSWTGYYPIGVGRILVKNCRCWAEPIIPQYRG